MANNLAKIIKDTFEGKWVYWSKNHQRQGGQVLSIYNGKAIVVKPNGRKVTLKLNQISLGFYPGLMVKDHTNPKK